MAARLLLLGASGFAGSHLRREAIARGHQVTGVSRTPAAGDLTADLLDPASLAAAIDEAEPDWIANLAGEASVARSWSEPAAALEANALGALNLLEAVAAGAPRARVLCISSGEAYGAVPEDAQPITETRPLRPLSPYGASKAMMEQICERYADRGVAIVVARAFNHTGPGQSERFAIASWAQQIAGAERAGAESLELAVGALELLRDFSDVRDTVRAYAMLLERETVGTYNVCSGEPTRLRDLVEALAAHSPLRVTPVVEDRRVRPDEPPMVIGSPAKLQRDTGWRAQRTIDETVADLLDAARKAEGG